MPIENNAESFSYEFGTLLQTSSCLLVAQISYVCFTSMICLPGSPGLWLLLMYLTATIVSVAYDIHFLQDTPTAIIQCTRVCTDIAIYILTVDFFLVGDGAHSQKAIRLANKYVNSLGRLSATLFFIPALYIANLAFMSLTRMIVNAFLMVFIGVGSVLEYFSGRRSCNNATLTNETEDEIPCEDGEENSE